jgi:hypothetical protein
MRGDREKCEPNADEDVELAEVGNTLCFTFGAFLLVAESIFSVRSGCFRPAVLYHMIACCLVLRGKCAEQGQGYC